jgi:thiol:disulfide interchange protein DsbA
MTTRVLLSVLTAFMVSVATAQNVPIAGIDYQEIKSPSNASPQGTIEVVEYFWYRCPHCYALEPLLEPWAARLPGEARFRRVPAVLGKGWTIDARIFYALEEIGELNRLHRPLLDAIHQNGGRRLDGDAYERWVSDWLRNQGVDVQRYAAAFESAAVREKTKRAADLSRALQIEGTPTFLVAGRYLVSPPPGDRRRILEITDYLISRAQADKLARR